MKWLMRFSMVTWVTLALSVPSVGRVFLTDHRPLSMDKALLLLAMLLFTFSWSGSEAAKWYRAESDRAGTKDDATEAFLSSPTGSLIFLESRSEEYRALSRYWTIGIACGIAACGCIAIMYIVPALSVWCYWLAVVLLYAVLLCFGWCFEGTYRIECRYREDLAAYRAPLFVG